MRITRITALFLLVLVTGFASGWTAENWHRNHYAATLEQKRYCSTLAEEYHQQQIREHEVSNERYLVSLLHVEYSGARNSCVAQVSTSIPPPGDDIYAVVDLL
jgi:hypothetical protein